MPGQSHLLSRGRAINQAAGGAGRGQRRRGQRRRGFFWPRPHTSGLAGRSTFGACGVGGRAAVAGVWALGPQRGFAGHRWASGRLPGGPRAEAER